jgi:hypothetical protein
MKQTLFLLVVILHFITTNAQTNRIGIGINNFRVGFSKEDVDTVITRNFSSISLQPYVHYTKMLPSEKFYAVQFGFSKLKSSSIDKFENLAGNPNTDGFSSSSNNTFLGFIFGKSYSIDKFTIQPSLKAQLNLQTNSKEARSKKIYDPATGSIVNYYTTQDVTLASTAEFGLYFAQGIEYNLSKKIKIGSFINLGLRYSRFFGTKNTIYEDYIRQPLEFSSYTRNQQYNKNYNISTNIYPSFQFSYAF